MVNRSGQALVEYVIITSLVALGLIAALLILQASTARGLSEKSETVEECASPGHGGANPGRDGGTPRGRCLDGS
jgi:Flp pilus assembly pilin Flp